MIYSREQIISLFSGVGERIVFTEKNWSVANELLNEGLVLFCDFGWQKKICTITQKGMDYKEKH